MTKASQNAIALVKKDVVDVVQSKVQDFVANKELVLPANYSAENAMKSAWLQLQSITDKNNKPVLESCKKDTIANALLDMVVQGLNPAKKQCYFVAYGGKLELMRSYFGTIAAAKTTDPRIGDITYQVIRQGDEVEIGIDGTGIRHIIKHSQPFENLDNEVAGAYCNIYDKEGDLMHCEIMTIKQLKQVWQQGKFSEKMNPIDKNGNIKPDSVHGKYTDQMALKSVINRGLKYFINTSSDTGIIAAAFNNSLGNEFRDEVDEANGSATSAKRVISLDEEPEPELKVKDNKKVQGTKSKINVVDADFEEVKEEKTTTKKATANKQATTKAPAEAEQQGFDDGLEGTPFDDSEDIPY